MIILSKVMHSMKGDNEKEFGEYFCLLGNHILETGYLKQGPKDTMT